MGFTSHFSVQVPNEFFFLNFRAQDKAAIQLSELEEEMDQRIHAVENETRKDVSLWIDHSFIWQIFREHLLLWNSVWCQSLGTVDFTTLYSISKYQTSRFEAHK